jgi:hypothetical protein
METDLQGNTWEALTGFPNNLAGGNFVLLWSNIRETFWVLPGIFFTRVGKGSIFPRF